jgi:hypothetical protein
MLVRSSYISFSTQYTVDHLAIEAGRNFYSSTPRSELALHTSTYTVSSWITLYLYSTVLVLPRKQVGALFG